MGQTVYSGDVLQHRIKPDSDLADVLEHAMTCKQKDARNAKQEAAYITAKLFLPRDVSVDEAEKSVKEALDVCRERKQGIKQFIIALQDLTFSDILEDGSPCEVSGEKISQIWKLFTACGAESGFVDEFGISELSTERLTDLLNHIDTEGDSPVPTIDHINATDCCALPPGLIALSKERNIKLLAHHDPEELLPEDRLKRIYPNAQKWQWILRLTSIVKDRQVLAGNEYYVNFL